MKKQLKSFNHANAMLDFLGEAACPDNVLNLNDFHTFEDLQKQARDLQESICDWDLIIDMQLERNLDQYGLECLKSDRKNRQQVINELRMVKNKMKEMMKNNNTKELIVA